MQINGALGILGLKWPRTIFATFWAVGRLIFNINQILLCINSQNLYRGHTFVEISKAFLLIKYLKPD